MASSGKAMADPEGLVSLILTFGPFTTHTVATLVLHRRDSDGSHDRVLARWHLSITRSDLAGHSTPDAVESLVDMVLHRLRSGGSDPADRVTHSDPVAAGSGAPLGATGGTVTQPPLPGL